jgi:hypothetical protein
MSHEWPQVSRIELLNEAIKFMRDDAVQLVHALLHAVLKPSWALHRIRPPISSVLGV